MGVRGLSALLKDKGEQINLKEYAKKYLEEKGKRLRFSCDGWALVYWLLRRGYPHADPRFGGQHWALSRSATEFAAKMKQIEIELVVVFDGPTGPDKKDESLTRTKERISAAAKIWRELWATGEYDPHLDASRAPLLARNAVQSALIEAGIDCRACSVEADSVIAGLCLKGECNIAISNDSDYFVLGCDYIPMDSFKFKPSDPNSEIEGRLFTLASVAAALKVHPKLLQLVANMAGNDYTFSFIPTIPKPNATENTSDSVGIVPPVAVAKTAALISAIEFVQKHESELLSVIDNIPELLKIACKDNADFACAVEKGLKRYKETEPAQLADNLKPLIGTSLLGSALYGFHFSSIVPEDLGSKHPKFSALYPIAEVIRPILVSLYSIVVGSGKEIEEIWQNRGTLVSEKIKIGSWPFKSVPESALLQIRALPEQNRKALFLEIFDIGSEKLQEIEKLFSEAEKTIKEKPTPAPQTNEKQAEKPAPSTTEPQNKPQIPPTSTTTATTTSENAATDAAAAPPPPPPIVEVPKAKLIENEQAFTLFTIIVVNYLMKHSSEIGLPLLPEEICSFISYVYERKTYKSWNDTPKIGEMTSKTPRDEFPYVARSVHLFNLFQQIYSLVESANIILGNPFGENKMPNPQSLFDGITWINTYRRIRKNGMTSAEANWGNKFAQPVVTHTQQAMKVLKKEQEKRKQKEREAREHSREATSAKNAAKNARKTTLNAFDLLGDK